MTNLSRPAVALLAIIALVFGAIGGVAVTSTFTAGDGTAWGVDGGPEIAVGAPTVDIESGNPVKGPTNVTIHNVSFTSPGDTVATAARLGEGETWTNVTDVDAGSVNLSIDAPGKRTVSVGGGIDAISISDDIDATTTGDRGLVVDAPNPGTLTVDTDGAGAVAVDSSGQAIDDGDVQPDGTVVFDIPSGTHNIDLQPAPSSLFIYNASDPDQLIQDNVTLRVRLFGSGDTVVEQEVTDGELELGDVPADQRYVITVSDAGNNYVYRRDIVDSLTQQQDVYLLSTSAPSVDVELAFTDYTGLYPNGETYLYIEKPIQKDFDGDGTAETRYRVITGDTIGPTGAFPATLERDQRYRLRIQNGPNQRLLGGYTATRAEVTEITIRGRDLEPPESQTYAIKQNITRGADGQRDLTVKYADESQDTSRLFVGVRNRTTGEYIYIDRLTNGPIQNYSVYDIPLANGSAYELVWNATRDGEEIGSTLPIGRGSAGIKIPLDPQWLWTSSMVAIVFVASLAGARKHTYIGIATVGIAGVFMYLNTIDIFVPLWWLALLIGIGGYLRDAQSPGE